MLDQVMVKVPFQELKVVENKAIKYEDLFRKLAEAIEVDDTALDKYCDANEEHVIVKVADKSILEEILQRIAFEKNELTWMLNPELMKVDWGDSGEKRMQL